MRNYILRRLVVMGISMVGVSIIIFLSIRLIPGDVVEVMVAQQGSMGREQIEQMRRLFGLDRPLYVQYIEWATGLLRGDFGYSLRTGRPILNDILLRLPVTLELSVLAATFAVLIAVPSGIIAAVKQDSLLSLAAQTWSLAGLSIPAFWFGTMVILVSSRYLGFYGGGTYISPFDNLAGNLKMFTLPSITVGLSLSASLMRYTRSAMLEVLSQDYIRTARAKGLIEQSVIYKHALRNAMIPIVTVIGLQLGFLMGGVVVIETVFALPGMGRLIIDAINQRDYPMVQSLVLLIAGIVMFASLVVDIIYSFIDPRVRFK